MPRGAIAVPGGLLFGAWKRARAAYWLSIASEGLTLLWIGTVGLLFAGLEVYVVGMVVFSSARRALLLSRPIRTMIGRRRLQPSITAAM